MSQSQHSAKSAAVGRQHSIMAQVHRRIEALSVLKGSERSNPAPPTVVTQQHTGGELFEQNAHALRAGLTPAAHDAAIKEHEERMKSGFHASFRAVVMCAVLSGALVTGALMFVPLEAFSQELYSSTLEVVRESVAMQRDLIWDLADSAEDTHRNKTLDNVSQTVMRLVKYPSDHAIDVIWGMMRLEQHFDSNYTGMEAHQRERIKYRALFELQDQWAMANTNGGRTSGVFVGFYDDCTFGATVSSSDAMAPMDAQFDTDERRVATLLSCGDGNTTALEKTNVAMYSRDQLETFMVEWDGATNRPWFRLQQDIADNSPPGTPVKRTWSEQYVFLNGHAGLTLTRPVAYCGDYSCMQGVVAADVQLTVVSQACQVAWKDFQRLVSGPAFGFTLTEENSAVLVIKTKGHDTDTSQGGLLVGASGTGALHDGNLTMASASPSAIVRVASEVLFDRFENWGSLDLQQDQHFTFRKAEAKNQNYGIECNLRDSNDVNDPDCMQVATKGVVLDDYTHWLIVVVSPAAAFRHMAVSVKESVESEVNEVMYELEHAQSTMRKSGAAIYALTAILSAVVGLLISFAVTRPLGTLRRQMQVLGTLEFRRGTEQEKQLREYNHSRIRDVCELQDAFVRLSNGIETFARFVPEAVVRAVVSGDPRARRLHVTKREVTCMFSDLRNFTTLAESLDLVDLVFVLTLYLSTMARIAEVFEGVVAEILGDGLLIFWNAGPVEVTEDHEAKACAAALAMQRAMAPLNKELQCNKDLQLKKDLPELAVRIGIHTGDVLAGNIGSDRKMKFGCMGDPVNLASRLEGICKVYGVGIICSNATYSGLREHHGFVDRKLDLARVKGRNEPVVLHEVMEQIVLNDCGCEHFDEEQRMGTKASGSFISPECAAMEAVLDTAEFMHDSELLDAYPVLRTATGRMRDQIRSMREDTASISCDARRLNGEGVNKTQLRLKAANYEEALVHYQAARFVETKDKLDLLLEDHPNDGPAKFLLERASQYLDETSKLSTSERDSWRDSWTGVLNLTEK